MAKLNLTIDGKSISADSENSVLEAANKAGIYIPQLCSHPDLKPSGECGLCAVEIEGNAELVQACNTKISGNMTVHTDTAAIRQNAKDFANSGSRSEQVSRSQVSGERHSGHRCHHTDCLHVSLQKTPVFQKICIHSPTLPSVSRLT